METEDAASLEARELDGHHEAVRLDIREVARRLNKVLGAVLVSELAGAGSPKAATRWAQADGTTPRPETRRRLLFAYELLRGIEKQASSEVARNWFIGVNLWLDYDHPINAIREGYFKEVAEAAGHLMVDLIKE